jgi:hypothetical protein
MHPENDLLLRLLGGKSDGEGPTLSRCDIPTGLDWNRFISLCDWHNIIPHVYRSLQAGAAGYIPPEVVSRLGGLCRINTARTLALTSELSRILKALESCGVAAYPFKGPALSVILYGDPARRQSKDLDILIPKEELRRAMKVLDTLGYEAQNALGGPRLAAHRRTEYETAFSRRDGKLNVELQWAVVPGFFGFEHEKIDIWSNLKQQSWDRFTFPVLPPEETLLLLCVHGAKHLWCKLGWVCDVAGQLTSPEPPDLQRTLELAQRCGVARLLMLGLLLAERLAGAQLPQELSSRVHADIMAACLARKVREVIARSPVNPDVDPRRYLFYLKSKERRRDQLLFAGRLMATLAAGEWNPSALPDSLYPLYYVLRPLDLLRRHAGLQLRHRAAGLKP